MAQDNIPDYDNIEVQENEDGDLMLILSPEQYISVADYVEELEYEIDVLEAKLAKAEEKLEEAYLSKNEKAIDLSDVTLSAVAVVAIIAALAR